MVMQMIFTFFMQLKRIFNFKSLVMSAYRIGLFVVAGVVPFALLSCSGGQHPANPLAANDTAVIYSDWNSIRNSKHPDNAIGYYQCMHNDSMAVIV